MQNKRFHINLYILIPLIFSGFSVLSLLVAYQLTRFYLVHETAPEWPLTFWGIVLFVFTYVCGILVVKFIIEPVEKFIGRTQQMGVLSNAADDLNTTSVKTEVYQYVRIFDQVTEILSKVEARELFPEIVGQSTAIRRVLNQIIKVAPSSSTVLIYGETGTGKELVAKSIHRHSNRKDAPIIALNCAAIPQGLLESELFGHEKGAFTGATQRKAGKMEQANGGTLFLDEIGDMPLETQAKLLRALEENAVVRLGGDRSIRVNTRFITATNKNLPDLVDGKAFRQDLFFRLNVLVIYLPPLRDRREDIPLLASHFLKIYAPDKRLSTGVIQILMAYDWPGNVRELQNVIQSSAVMGNNEIIELSHLPGFLTQATNHLDRAESMTNSNSISESIDIDATLRELEKKILIRALTQCRGIQKQAADLLQIKERSLWHRLKKYEIDASSFKTLVQSDKKMEK